MILSLDDAVEKIDSLYAYAGEEQREHYENPIGELIGINSSLKSTMHSRIIFYDGLENLKKLAEETVPTTATFGEEAELYEELRHKAKKFATPALVSLGIGMGGTLVHLGMILAGFGGFFSLGTLSAYNFLKAESMSNSSTIKGYIDETVEFEKKTTSLEDGSVAARLTSSADNVVQNIRILLGFEPYARSVSEESLLAIKEEQMAIKDFEYASTEFTKIIAASRR